MLTIDICRPADLPQLRQLAIKTFIDTYAAHNTPEVMADYLQEAFNEQQLLSELNSPERFYYCLKLGGQWVGYIKLNEGSAQTETRTDNVLELERIYVDPQYKGRGFGKSLLEQAIAVARERRKDRLWLGVWEHNPKAIGFYESQGFVKTGTHIFMIGGEAQTDWVMEIVVG